MDGRFLDSWSIIHFIAFGLVLGWFSWLFGDMTFVEVILISLFLGGLWEILEHKREIYRNLPQEPWTNRLIGDILVDILGGLAGWVVYTLLGR